jgi:hypothetical protein
MRGLARVVVVVATGSGKSILAQRLATRLGAEYVELGALFWDAHWAQAAPEVFRARVARATAGPRADTIVWLDYAFPLVLRRLTARTVRRAITGEVLWNGNREYFWQHCRLWSEKSLFHWLVKTYWAYRRELPSSSPSPATSTSGSRTCAGPARRRRGSPASRRSDCRCPVRMSALTVQ